MVRLRKKSVLEKQEQKFQKSLNDWLEAPLLTNAEKRTWKILEGKTKFFKQSQDIWLKTFSGTHKEVEARKLVKKRAKTFDQKKLLLGMTPDDKKAKVLENMKIQAETLAQYWWLWRNTAPKSLIRIESWEAFKSKLWRVIENKLKVLKCSFD